MWDGEVFIFLWEFLKNSFRFGVTLLKTKCNVTGIIWEISQISYTGLFEMIVGVLTTLHTKYT